MWAQTNRQTVTGPTGVEVVNTGRVIFYRMQSWNPWQHTFYRLQDAIHT